MIEQFLIDTIAALSVAAGVIVIFFILMVLYHIITSGGK